MFTTGISMEILLIDYVDCLLEKKVLLTIPNKFCQYHFSVLSLHLTIRGKVGRVAVVRDLQILVELKS